MQIFESPIKKFTISIIAIVFDIAGILFYNGNDSGMVTFFAGMLLVSFASMCMKIDGLKNETPNLFNNEQGAPVSDTTKA